ncbi:hypothetical protein NYR90_07610 [Clostridioides difficile]|nr:hypothetical protein NYR90_07610 [Clostridioides difficile]
MSEKSIVIYYSQSGVTRQIAKKIQEMTGSDIYEIISNRLYNSDMWKAYEEAKAEIKSENMPKLSGKLPELKKYQKIYLGGPVWGGAPANPMKVFLKQVDFHSAYILPFWTFYDYEGDYEKDIINECKNAKFISGIGITNQMIHSNKLEEELKKKLSHYNLNI